MRKFFRVILPPFVGFAVYFIAVRYSSLYFTLRIDEMGLGNLTSFMAYYRYMLPLLFLCAVLTQLLIAKPAWDFFKGTPVAMKVSGLFDFLLICLLLAFGISYAIWDTTTGTRHLVKVTAFMTVVQIGYWLINLFILELLEKRAKAKEETNSEK